MRRRGGRIRRESWVIGRIRTDFAVGEGGRRGGREVVGRRGIGRRRERRDGGRRGGTGRISDLRSGTKSFFFF